MAKANPHWKDIGEGIAALAIFQGPHAYISPSWYVSRPRVPTWNYAAVHVYGKGRVITEESATRQVLDDLITQFDSSYNQQWNSFSDEYRNRMQRHIVAFEIIATRIETKFKLSQNRTKLEQENVIRALAKNSGSAISRVAELMRQQGLGVERT